MAVSFTDHHSLEVFLFLYVLMNAIDDEENYESSDHPEIPQDFYYYVCVLSFHIMQKIRKKM
jgi:hypothetical protein